MKKSDNPQEDFKAIQDFIETYKNGRFVGEEEVLLSRIINSFTTMLVVDSNQIYPQNIVRNCLEHLIIETINMINEFEENL